MRLAINDKLHKKNVANESVCHVLGVLYAYTGRELKIFGLYAVRLDGKSKECVAKLREIISESRFLIVPSAFTVFLFEITVYTFVTVWVCSHSHVNGEIVPVYLLYNGYTN